MGKIIDLPEYEEILTSKSQSKRQNSIVTLLVRHDEINGFGVKRAMTAYARDELCQVWESERAFSMRIDERGERLSEKYRKRSSSRSSKQNFT